MFNCSGRVAETMYVYYLKVNVSGRKVDKIYRIHHVYWLSNPDINIGLENKR